MHCGITEIPKAPNGQPSKLFLDLLNNTREQSIALRLYSKAVHNSNSPRYVNKDVNGEPLVGDVVPYLRETPGQAKARILKFVEANQQGFISPQAYMEARKAVNRYNLGTNLIELKKASSGSYYLKTTKKGNPFLTIADTNRGYTQENYNEAKKWLGENLPMVPVEKVAGLIAGKAFGQFSNSGKILLSDIAKEGTAYHEAFHAAFRLYAGPSEMVKMYSEARETFDAPSEKDLAVLASLHGTLSEDEIEDLYYEEQMAEDFRSYVMGGPVKAKKDTRTWFKKFLDFIRQVLSIDRGTIDQFYEKINTGHFAKNVNPSRSITSVSALAEGFNVKLFGSLFNRKHEDAITIEDFINMSSLEIVKMYRHTYHELRRDIKNQAVRYEDEAAVSAEDYAEFLYQKADGLIELWEQMGNPKVAQGIINEHSKLLSRYGLHIKFNVVKGDINIDNIEGTDDIVDVSKEDEESDAAQSTDFTFDRNANETSIRDYGANTIKLLIASLPERYTDQDLGVPTGEIVRDQAGLPRAVSSKGVFNFIANKLENFDSYEEMIAELQRHTDTIPSLNDLISYLSVPESKNAEKNIAHERVREQFRETFDRAKWDYATYHLEDEGNIYSSNPTSTALEKKVMSNWHANALNIAYSGNSKVLTKFRGVPSINLNELRKLKPKKGGLTKEHKLKMLEEVGITFSMKPTGRATKLELVEWMLEYKDEDGHVPLDRIFQDESRNMALLLEQEIDNSTNHTELMFVGPDGKKRYSMTLHNYHSIMVREIDKAQTLTKLFEKHPHLDNVYTKNSQLLKPGGLLFDKSGNRTGVPFKLSVITGATQGAGNKGQSHADLSEVDKAWVSFNSVLQGNYPYIRAADKTLEFSFKIGKTGTKKHFVVPQNIRKAHGVSPATVNIFKGYLTDELNRIKLSMDQGVGKSTQFYGKNTDLKNGYSYLIEEFISKKDFEGVVSGAITMSTVINRRSTVANIERYLNTKRDDYIKYMQETGLLNKRGVRYEFKGLSMNFSTDLVNDPMKMTEEELHDVMSLFTINDIIQRIETTKVLIGDPLAYKNLGDMFKRTPGATGTKRLPSTEERTNKFLNKWMPRKDGKVADGRFNALMLQDINSSLPNLDEYYDAFEKVYGKRLAKEYTDNYNNINEADAQGYITLDEYRELMWRAGQWYPKHEAAYKKLIAGEKLTKEEVFYFQPIKPQYFGPKLGKEFYNSVPEERIYSPVYLKFSLMPILPTVVKPGSKLDKLREQMSERQIGIAVFESGVKVGGELQSDGTPFSFYSDTQDASDMDGVSTMDLDYRHLGIQVDISPKVKDKGKAGSQIRKIIKQGLFSNGAAKAMSFYSRGTGMSSKSQGVTKEVVARYDKSIDNIIKLETSKLLRRLGFEKQGDVYVSQNDVNIREILLSAAQDKGATRNLIDSIQLITDAEEESFKKLRYPLESLPTKGSIERILMSLVKNSVIKYSVPGGPRIQAAGTGLEVTNREFKNDRIIASDDLKFYRKGKLEETLPMQVKVALPKALEEYVEYLGGLDVFNNLIQDILNDRYNVELQSKLGIDIRMLQGVGYRIPTQALPSIEAYEIAEFLPAESAEVIIVPTGLTTKSGSDFDIDKLNLISSSFSVTRELTRAEKSDIRTFFKVKGNLTEAQQETIAGLSDEQLEGMISDLNKFSLTSDKGEFGDLEDWISEKGFGEDSANFYRDVKDAVVSYNRENKSREVKNINYRLEYIEASSDPTTLQEAHNDNIEASLQIITSPENFSELITPVDAGDVMPTSYKMSYLKSGGEVKVKNGTPTLTEFELSSYKKKQSEKSLLGLLDWMNNLKVGRSYQAGKAGIGQAALHATSTNLFQQVGVQVKKADIARLGFKGMKNYFEISKETDFSGKTKISDTIKQIVNGYVDVSKDPWILYFNALPAVESTFLYLVRRGVPIETVGLFFNQPIVEQYIMQSELSKSEYAKASRTGKSKSNLIKDLLSEYSVSGVSYDASSDVIRMPDSVEKRELSDEGMISNIANHYGDFSMNEAQASMDQVKALADFLRYEKLGSQLSDVIQSTTQDTAVPKSLPESKVAKMLMRKAFEFEGEEINDKEDFHLEGYSKLFSDTLLKSFYEGAELTRELYKDYYITESPQFQEALELVAAPLIASKKGKTTIGNTLNKFTNDFIVYLYSNAYTEEGSRLSSYVTKLFGKGEKSFTKKVAKFVEANKHKDFFRTNSFLQNLRFIVDEPRAMTDNIQLFNNLMNNYDSDTITEDFRELLYMGVPIAKELVYFGMLQSGLNSSHLSYLDNIPFEFYADIAMEGIGKATLPGGKVDGELVTDYMDQFYRNNFQDDDVAPRLKDVKSEMGGYSSPIIGGQVIIRPGRANSQHRSFPYVKYWQEDPRLKAAKNRTEKQELRLAMHRAKIPTGKFRIFAKTKIKTDGTVVYAEVSRLGDGLRSKEYYPRLKASAFSENNVEKDSFTPLSKSTYTTMEEALDMCKVL